MNVVNILGFVAIGLVVFATMLMMVASIKHRLYKQRMIKLLKEWDLEDSKTTMLAARSTKVGLGPLGLNQNIL